MRAEGDGAIEQDLYTCNDTLRRPRILPAAGMYLGVLPGILKVHAS
jgi:hypothetical protein